MGTPEFAVPVLAALVDSGYDVAGAYTRPDKPAGRGRRVAPPPVKLYADHNGMPVFQPSSLKPARVNEELASLSPEVIVVAAYGRFLPRSVLELPPLGCLNVHPSLLPKHRGPSPVASAVLNGDPVTGVTIMKIDEGTDSGPIIARQETAVGPREDAEELTKRLFQMGAGLLVEVLPAWGRGEIRAEPQDESQATTTRLLSREDGRIDWQVGAAHIARQVLAYAPWPGSFTYWGGKLLKVLEADAVDSPCPLPGQVTSLPDGGLGIGAGEGVLVVHRLQLAGKRAMDAREFVQGHGGFVGSFLGE